MTSIKTFINKYKHGFFLFYGVLYLIGFYFLEQKVTTEYNIIHMAIDDMIPFCEFFIIPYILWFLFIAVTVVYFLFFEEKTDYYRLIGFLFTGMTLFLIISWIYPNGHELRPTTFARDNVFVDMVKSLYRTDTPTNILPSIHVYNSIGVLIAILKSKKLNQIAWIKYGSILLSTSIICATVFLKQHSMVDVLLAFGMSLVFYFIFYKVLWKTPKNLSH